MYVLSQRLLGITLACKIRELSRCHYLAFIIDINKNSYCIRSSPHSVERSMVFFYAKYRVNSFISKE